MLHWSMSANIFKVQLLTTLIEMYCQIHVITIIPFETNVSQYKIYNCVKQQNVMIMYNSGLIFVTSYNIQ